MISVLTGVCYIRHIIVLDKTSGGQRRNMIDEIKDEKNDHRDRKCECEQPVSSNGFHDRR